MKINKNLAVLAALTTVCITNYSYGADVHPLAASGIVFASGATSPETAQAEAEQKLATLTNSYIEIAASQEPFLMLMSGKPVTKFPTLTYAAALERSQTAQENLEKLNEIDRSALTHEGQITAKMFEWQMKNEVKEADYYWLGFVVTPYQSGMLFSSIFPPAFQNNPLKNAEERALYVSLIADAGRVIKEQHEKLAGQEKRDILLPKAAVPGVRAVYESLRGNMAAIVHVADAKLEGLSAEEKAAFKAQVTDAVEQQVYSAIDAMLAYLDDDYVAKAPEAVGLAQYKGGKEYYQYLIEKETTQKLSPEKIHQLGLDYMQEIQGKMAKIREQLGFKGTQAEFHEKLRHDPRFLSKTPEALEVRFKEYIERLRPKVAEYFSLTPKAPYGVKRLDLAAEAGMTYGYYEAPNAKKEYGYYRYNGSNLDNRPLVWIAALTYHELVPGHHFHIALQRENEKLSEYRQKGAFYTAFNEGWANYAASLSFEMGLMDDLYDQYGWLLFDSFITNRLVVDTGMNYYGWSLEKAQAYMRDNTFSSEQEAELETLRYSTDLPAQALAYKLGYNKFWEIRHDAEKHMGDAFNIKDFHAAVIGSGAMPLPILAEHVSWYLNQSR
ncbi:DUF885 domain-containing protein [Kordiimonas pumila]|uniref:DUF885 domain-containing protein n=1 Tax=Kordiimonas pumila TaxID=2161677 RepID=A0ABV7D7R3_9PROT|nr:DUF885 domain-containing protein [Kordiimonas pumila]